MRLNKGTKRRAIVYFTIITLLLVFATISLTVSLPLGLAGKHWRNSPGNVTIGEMTTYYNEYSIRPEADSSAIVIARNENGSPTVKGMPINLFVYGIGEDFQLPEHPMFKTSKAMLIVSYCLSLLLILCILCILGSIFIGFRKGIYFNKSQVILLRLSALVSFLLAITGELGSKCHKFAIGELYGQSSEIKLATNLSLDLNDILIPLFVLMLAEVINIAVQLNKEESMTI